MYACEAFHTKRIQFNDHESKDNFFKYWTNICIKNTPMKFCYQPKSKKITLSTSNIKILEIKKINS